MKRFAALLLTLILPAVSVPAATKTIEKLSASPRHQEYIDVARDGRTVHAFVVYPEIATKAPAVIIIHENRGLTDWVRSFADQIAEAGYIAIAPDLLSDFDEQHHRSSDFPDEDAARDAIYKLSPEQVMGDLKAVQGQIASIPSATRQVFVIGFCWGGGQAFRLASEAKGLSAAMVFYGTAPDEKAIPKISAPVYGFYGGNDERISGAVPDVQKLMKKNKKAYEPAIYKGATHAFMKKADEGNGSPDDKTARDASWERIKAILSGNSRTDSPR